jgi:RNA-directed DNA polymerase
MKRYGHLRPKGLPIGNLTSQFFANLYLNQFDHFVSQKLKPSGYLRYVDDFALFSNDRDQLCAACPPEWLNSDLEQAT